MNQFAGVDRALDEMLVQLGGMVLRLSSPQVTRTPEERHALAVLGQSIFDVCGALGRSARARAQDRVGRDDQAEIAAGRQPVKCAVGSRCDAGRSGKGGRPGRLAQRRASRFARPSQRADFKAS